MSSPVFLLSLPRSGSTLFMRILRRGENARFGGETHDFLPALRRMHGYRADLLRRFPQAATPIEEQAAANHYPAFWFQASQAEWDAAIVHLMHVWMGLTGKTEFWGWKEVVMGRSEDDVQTLSWLANLLPNARFVLLHRRLREAAASMRKSPDWWRTSHGEPAAFESVLERQWANLLRFASMHPDRCMQASHPEILRWEFWRHFSEYIGLRLCKPVFEEEISRTGNYRL